MGIRLWLIRPRTWTVGTGASTASLNFRSVTADDQRRCADGPLFAPDDQMQTLLEQPPHHEAHLRLRRLRRRSPSTSKRTDSVSRRPTSSSFDGRS